MPPSPRSAIVAASVSLLLSTAACERPPDPGAFEAELMAADRAFNEVTQARGSAGWVTFFAEQGSMIQSGVGEIHGLDAIGAAIADLDDPDVTLTWEPIRAEGSHDRSLGYTVGRYESTVAGASGTSVSHGLYVTIWRRQPDGTLKVVMDLGNPVRD